MGFNPLSLGVIPFVKAAGRGIGKIFKGKEAEEKLKKEVEDYGLTNDKIDISVDDDGKVTVKGNGVSQEMKEKIILAVGNVEGVGEVEDGIEAEGDATPSVFHTVEKGDTLWAIASKHYGKGARYTEIFEANRPMLSHPDKIYPGQVLRIPQEAKTATA